MTKLCPRCKEEKPTAEFGRDRSRPDGLFSYCRACAHAAAKKHRQTPHGREKHRADKAAWFKTPRGKATLAAVHLRWRRSGKGKAYWQKLKESGKAPARSAVSKAVRLGKLPPAKERACQQCGQQAREYHHHLGYSPEHYLDVTPLCIPCHRRTC